MMERRGSNRDAQPESLEKKGGRTPSLSIQPLIQPLARTGCAMLYCTAFSAHSLAVYHSNKKEPCSSLNCYCSTISHLPPGELPSKGAGLSFEYK